jgi:hypothetical protein
MLSGGKRLVSYQRGQDLTTYQRKEAEEGVNNIWSFYETAITDTVAVVRVFQDLLKLEDRIDRDKEHFYAMH